MRIFWRDSRPRVDWAWLGGRRFTEPYFDQTIDQCLQRPADLLFRHQTDLEELGQIAAAQPGLKPAGFVFHLSRCGSTLVSQMLAAVAGNVVISEAPPVDAVLRAHFQHTEATEERRAQWLQWLVAALAWRRHAEEKNFFIKFDCWHTLFLPLIQRAFPDVPWIFVYRDPLEVMASHLARRGAQMIPGVLEPGLFGWNADVVDRMAPGEYGARVLAGICEAALAGVRRGNGRLVNYRQLPDAVWPALMTYWKLEPGAEETARMLGASRMDARNPSLPYEVGNREGHAAVPEQLRTLGRQWLEGVYQQLEAQRVKDGFA